MQYTQTFTIEPDFRYKHEICKPSGTIDTIVNWCKSELQPSWRWNIIEFSGSSRPGRYVFYFNDEKDYLAFILKWS